MKTFLAAIGLSAMVVGIIDSVHYDMRKEYGWALWFKILALHGAVLCAAALT